MSIISKSKSLFIYTCLIIMMTGSVPGFGYRPDLMPKTELTVYEQYIKKHIEQIEKVYTPEKYFPQKNMQLELKLRYKILPDGSVSDIQTIWSSEDLDHEDPTWVIRPLYFWKLKRLSRKYEQYVRNMLSSIKSEPLPEGFGDYILVNSLKLKLFNYRFRKLIFKNYIQFNPVFSPDERDNYTFTSVRMYRSNYTSGK